MSFVKKFLNDVTKILKKKERKEETSSSDLLLKNTCITSINKEFEEEEETEMRCQMFCDALQRRDYVLANDFLAKEAIKLCLIRNYSMMGSTTITNNNISNSNFDDILETYFGDLNEDEKSRAIRDIFDISNFVSFEGNFGGRVGDSNHSKTSQSNQVLVLSDANNVEVKSEVGGKTVISKTSHLADWNCLVHFLIPFDETVTSVKFRAKVLNTNIFDPFGIYFGVGNSSTLDFRDNFFFHSGKFPYKKVFSENSNNNNEKYDLTSPLINETYEFEIDMGTGSLKIFRLKDGIPSDVMDSNISLSSISSVNNDLRFVVMLFYQNNKVEITFSDSQESSQSFPSQLSYFDNLSNSEVKSEISSPLIFNKKFSLRYYSFMRKFEIKENISNLCKIISKSFDTSDILDLEILCSVLLSSLEKYEQINSLSALDSSNQNLINKTSENNFNDLKEKEPKSDDSNSKFETIDFEEQIEVKIPLKSVFTMEILKILSKSPHWSKILLNLMNHSPEISNLLLNFEKKNFEDHFEMMGCQKPRKYRARAMKHLRKDMCDFSIFVKEKESTTLKEIKCHKIVLLLNSQFFHCLLSEEMEKSKTTKIESITLDFLNLNLNQIKVFVEFLYCGNLSILNYKDDKDMEECLSNVDSLFQILKFAVEYLEILLGECCVSCILEKFDEFPRNSFFDLINKYGYIIQQLPFNYQFKFETFFSIFANMDISSVVKLMSLSKPVQSNGKLEIDYSFNTDITNLRNEYLELEKKLINLENLQSIKK